MSGRFASKASDAIPARVALVPGLPLAVVVRALIGTPA
jgi:hypothetical protein